MNDGHDFVSKLKTKPSLSESETFTDWPAPASNPEPNPENTVQDLSKRLPPENDTNSTTANNNNNINNNNNHNNNNNTSTLDGNVDFKRLEYGYKLEHLGTESFINPEDSVAPTDLTQSGKIPILLYFSNFKSIFSGKRIIFREKKKFDLDTRIEIRNSKLILSAW